MAFIFVNAKIKIFNCTPKPKYWLTFCPRYFISLPKIFGSISRIQIFHPAYTANVFSVSSAPYL